MTLPRPLNFIRHQASSVPNPSDRYLARALHRLSRHDRGHQSIRPTSVLAAGRREMAEVKIVAAVAMRTLSKKKNANL